MSSKYSTQQQHAPLRVPDNWGMQEKRFVAQLEEVLDDIYKRFGRLREEDLGENLRKTIVKSAESASEAIQTANSFEQKIDSANGNASSALQTANSFTAKFQSIGTVAPQTGITKIDGSGLTITHSNIGGRTQLSADGMRIFDASGNVIGGTTVLSGQSKAQVVVAALRNPSYPRFHVEITRWYDGESSDYVYGLLFFIDNVQICGFGAYEKYKTPVLIGTNKMTCNMNTVISNFY